MEMVNNENSISFGYRPVRTDLGIHIKAWLRGLSLLQS